MFKLIKPIALTALAILLSSCGSDSVKNKLNPEDTVLLQTSDNRPDWIVEMNSDEQELILDELEDQGLEIRETEIPNDDIWGDPNQPKITVYFGLDEWVIGPNDQDKVQIASDRLIKNPDLSVLLTGFCDWRGTGAYNLALGEKRANYVKDYLVRMGVPENRINILSRGDLDAMVDATPAQMAKERRVEILIVRQS